MHSMLINSNRDHTAKTAESIDVRVVIELGRTGMYYVLCSASAPSLDGKILVPLYTKTLYKKLYTEVYFFNIVKFGDGICVLKYSLSTLRAQNTHLQMILSYPES